LFTATVVYAVTTLNELVAYMLNLFEENKNLKLENRLRVIIKEELKSELETVKDDIKTIKSQHSWLVQSIRSIAGQLKINLPAVEITPIVEKIETSV
jgi:regulator of replication initiation timing